MKKRKNRWSPSFNEILLIVAAFSIGLMTANEMPMSRGESLGLTLFIIVFIILIIKNALEFRNFVKK